MHDNAANIEREVDIVIETRVGDYSLVIGVECQGRGRVANVEWVEQMAAKHETLPTNKLILISKSGFSETACRKARIQGIQTMTLDEAIHVDWAVLTSKKSAEVEKFAIEPAAYFALLAQHGEHIPVIVEADQQFYGKEGNEVLTAKEIVSLLMDIHLEDITKQMKWDETDETGRYAVFTLDFNLPAGTYFIDTLGNNLVMSGLRVLGHYMRESELIHLQSNSFGSAQVAFGETQTVDAKSLVCIVEHEDKPNTAAIMQPSDSKNASGIVHLRAVKD